MSDLERLPLAAILLTETRIASAAGAFADLLGSTPSELVGTDLVEFLGPEEATELGDWLRSPPSSHPWHDPNVLQVGGIGAGDLPFVADLAAGELSSAGHRLVTASPAGPPVLRPEDPSPDYVRRSEWELLGIDRMLSHDVRGALRGTSSFLSLLERTVGGELSDDAREYLGTATGAASRADTMVERLVHLLRVGIRPVRVAPVELAEGLTDALAVSDASFEGAAVEVRGGPSGAALVDRGLLVECLAELLTNARKFAGRPVTVSVSDRTLGPWVYVEVTDDGPGIPAEFAQDAFKPFRLLQAKGRFPGVGLGLTICREIARVHGGRCWVEEAEIDAAGTLNGTTVSLRLPAA